jgi:hypothetical protein
MLRETDLVIIRGGLPGGITIATSGDRAWHRAAGEDEGAFIARARAEALALSLPYVVAGGLPDEREMAGS